MEKAVQTEITIPLPTKVYFHHLEKEFPLAGPYADGSYSFDYRFILTTDSDTKVNELSEQEIFDFPPQSLVIAIYESDPHFWAKHDIFGPNQLLAYLLFYHPDYSPISPFKDTDILPLMRLFPFSLATHVLNDDNTESTEEIVNSKNKDVTILYIQKKDDVYLNGGKQLDIEI